MPQIQITVAPAGTTTLETFGYQGSACQAASRFLETALGTPRQDTLKADYYQTAITAPDLQLREPEPPAW